MGLKYFDFPIHGIDVSHHNGEINWTKVSAQFSVIRVGYGDTKDLEFDDNCAKSAGKTFRLFYWYMDYYSNHPHNGYQANNLSNKAWGEKQAINCWNWIKDMNIGPIFLDIESGSLSYSPPIYSVWDRAQEIAEAFLNKLDELSGITNGIYCSLSKTYEFNSALKTRPLWVAWYEETKSIQNVINAVKAGGYQGEVLIWQYTPDGDIDDNGTPDGAVFGMMSPRFDMNVWCKSIEDFNKFRKYEGMMLKYPVESLSRIQ